MLQRAFYLEQADHCAREANYCALDNQRAKFLAAEKAWRKLADMPITIGFVRAAAIST